MAILMAFSMFTCVPVFADYTTEIEETQYGEYDIPAYDGDGWEDVNGGVPIFTQDEIGSSEFEYYGDLDGLGRCTVCEAHLTADLMPTWDRGSISSIKPTGWVNKQYDTSIVGGIGWLWNRCHLIGFQLTGVDNVNDKKIYAKQDLITGTRYLNVGTGSTGMVGYENAIAKYVKNGGEVLYRVTPVFVDDNLVANGVLMEGQSVDEGSATDDISFCIFCYNVQPGIAIDYETGDNKLAEEMNVRDISECEISIKANYTYTGKQIKPEPVITCEDRTLEKGIDYTLSYGTNKAIGKGKVIVAGAGDFGGTTELSFSIVPKGTTISGVTAGKKKLTVKWKKQTSQTTGYKIQYSTNSDFSNAKTITIKKNTTVKRVIKSLSAKKNYYVRICTYKGSYKSDWSKSVCRKTK